MKRLISLSASFIMITTLFSFFFVGSASAHSYQSSTVLKPMGTAPSCQIEHSWQDQLLGVNNDQIYYIGDQYIDGCIKSLNDRYVLVIQADGNLVLYDTVLSGQQAIWSDNTAGKIIFSGSNYAQMQSDCNFVNYESSIQPVWSSRTNGRGNACVLRLQNDGNLVIYGNQASANAESGSVIWATGTEGK
ncbi:hypothetical protein [Dictyobacter kobayashii]|uniref:Bulb-type lectin domain-containing protein n=1 Tax=Dictyobacter kobayashii TaxID=2014872 RepID=A0A402AI99_9CHLR|nr:hypothetical protein [Dictyobacter kobayashii]GCE18783.1 hypothetical protein KDK_25830 [Dictyobacter kobayashii]